MSIRDAKRGAAIAGAILLAMPVLEVALGLGTPGPIHFMVGILGVGLLAVARG